MREVFLNDFPNPERTGCPGSETIRALAFGKLRADEAHRWWSHLSRCSPCTREFAQFRQEAVRAKRIRMASLIAAAAVLIVVLGWAVVAKLGVPLGHGVVDAALEANRKEQIRDFGPYLFKSFVRKAKLLMQRSQRVEYLDPEELAALKSVSDTSFVEDLERHIQLEEAVRMMDDDTRASYSMRVQGLTLREIGARLGMSEDAVRKDFVRGVERVKRLIQEGPKNDPNR